MYNKLVAGSTEIEIIAPLGGPAVHEGITVDSMRLILSNDITEEQIKELLEKPWNLYTHDGHFIKTYSGYNYLAEYSITFYKIHDTNKVLIELDNAANEITEARALAEEKTQVAEAAQKAAEQATQKLNDACAEINALTMQADQKEQALQSANRNAQEMQKMVEAMSQQMQSVMETLQFAGININSLMEARSMAYQETKTMV